MMKDKYKVLIISCWVLLILALVAKLAGANIFYPKTDNSNFIKVCNYIDNNLWLKYLVNCIMSLVLNSFTILAILGRRFYNKIQFIIYIPLIIAMSLTSWNLKVVNIILSISYYLVAIIWLRKRWYRALIGLALTLIFQVISLLAKNIGSWNLNTESSLIVIIMEIDSLIMIILYYLYSNYLELKKNLKGGE